MALHGINHIKWRLRLQTLTCTVVLSTQVIHTNTKGWFHYALKGCRYLQESFRREPCSLVVVPLTRDRVQELSR